MRRLFFIFGSPSARRLPFSVCVSDLGTLIIEPPRSTSSQFSPSSSPHHMPVVEGEHVEGFKAVSSFRGRILRGFVLRAFRLDRTASCLWQVLDRFVFGACGPTLCFSKKPDHSEERPDGAGDKDEQISYRDAQSSDAQRDASFRIALRASSYTQHTRLL